MNQMPADNAGVSNAKSIDAHAHVSVQDPSNAFVLLQNDRGAVLSVSVIDETLAVEFRVKDRIVFGAVLGTQESVMALHNVKNFPCVEVAYDPKTNECLLTRRDDQGLVSKTTL